MSDFQLLLETNFILSYGLMGLRVDGFATGLLAMYMDPKKSFCSSFKVVIYYIDTFISWYAILVFFMLLGSTLLAIQPKSFLPTEPYRCSDVTGV